MSASEVDLLNRIRKFHAAFETCRWERFRPQRDSMCQALPKRKPTLALRSVVYADSSAAMTSAARADAGMGGLMRERIPAMQRKDVRW